MRKVCIMLGSLNGVGGTGRAVSILANHLCDIYNVKILCYDQDIEHIGYEVDKRISIDSVFSKPTRMTYGIFKMVSYMTKYLKDNDIETVIVCGTLNFVGGIIAARLSGTKVICCDHSNYTCVYDAKFERESRNFAAYYSDYLVTLTEKDVDNYKNGTKVRAQILAIPNIIDDKLIFGSEDIQYNISSNRIVSVGRLTYAKNYELLIEIAKEVLDSNPGWSWDIYGTGELEKSLLEKKDKINVPQLFFKGNVDNMYDLYSKYSFLVMTSRYEGFPMVLIEAMARKLPCLAFDCQTGPSDIISNGINGFVLHEDKNSMINAIQNMIDNKTLRKQFSDSTKISLEKFSTEITIKKWEEII